MLNVLKLQRFFFAQVAYGRIGQQNELSNFSVRRLKFQIACVRSDIKTTTGMNIIAHFNRRDQIHCITKRREENVAVMVPANGKDGASSLNEGMKAVLDNAYTCA